MDKKNALLGKELIDSIQQMSSSRDLIGYANHPPKVAWKNNAKVAIQFVLNYEEGAENHVECGDAGSEQFLSEIIGAQSYPDIHKSMDSLYEYGSRAGFWRIHKEFQKRNLPLTVFGVGMALARNPFVVEAIQTAGYDVVSHGQRWIHYQHIDPVQEKHHMQQAISVLNALFPQKTIGWYTGRDSPNTRQLLAEFPQIQYDSDYYGDDLPFWTTLTNQNQETRPHLIIPYTLDTNDMKFCSAGGFNHAEQFYQYLKDAFDVLYEEGKETPKMLSIGMHCRILGRPARFKALQKFLDYVQQYDDIWICKRSDIAEHWYRHHFPK